MEAPPQRKGFFEETPPAPLRTQLGAVPGSVPLLKGGQRKGFFDAPVRRAQLTD